MLNGTVALDELADELRIIAARFGQEADFLHREEKLGDDSTWLVCAVITSQ